MSFEQLVAITGGKMVEPSLAAQSFSGVSIDTRTIEAGQLFIAMSGEQTDGHKFVGKAASANAGGMIIERTDSLSNDLRFSIPAMLVDNSHDALIKMAIAHRDKINPVRFGITGSNGKTTTKEFAAMMLGAIKQNVYKSPGNYNNLLGIPLALLMMPDNTEFAMLEMGISTPGEMKKLATIVKPDVFTITNVGPTHLEFLDTVENVAREKLNAIELMSEGQPVIANADDKIIINELKRRNHPYTTFGIINDADFMPNSKEIDNAGHQIVTIEGYKFRLQLFGQYQVYNLLAAYAMIRAAGYNFDDCNTEQIDLTSTDMRGEIISVNQVTFVSDCYNANPGSVQQGLESFAAMQSKGRKIVILGDMLELGNHSDKYHREAGVQVANANVNVAYFIGEDSNYAAEEAVKSGMSASCVHHYDQVETASVDILKQFSPNDLVYLKGSRGVGLEKILNDFRAGESV